MPFSFRLLSSRIVSGIAVLPALFAAAYAQEESNASEPPVSGAAATRRNTYYFSFYTGTTAAKSSDLRLLQPGFGTDVTYHGVNWDARSFIGSPYYGVKLGYFLPKSPRLGLELEFNHAKMYAKLGESKHLTGTWQGQPVDTVEPMSDRVDKYQITNGINAFSFNFVYRIPVEVSEKYPEGRWQPYVGGGPQYTMLYSINIIDGEGVRQKYHPNGWGYQLFGGARYLIHSHLGAFIEGKYQHGDAVSLIADKDANDGGRGITDIRLAHLAGGVFYQF